MLMLATGSNAGSNWHCHLLEWGLNGNAGSLLEIRASGVKFVSIDFLSGFGSGPNPIIKLAGHCNLFVKGEQPQALS